MKVEIQQQEKENDIINVDITEGTEAVQIWVDRKNKTVFISHTTSSGAAALATLKFEDDRVVEVD